ncbi:MAG: hypothetical protein ABIF87_12595 [Pseudomonadota bacterium]
MEYSLQFSQRLIDAARSFLDKEKVDDETGRAVLYLSLLSCEISLKALLEQAGYTIKELKKRSHDFSGLVKDLCQCDLINTGITGSKPYTGATLLSQEVDPNIGNGTVGALLKGEEQGASKYPNEIRYGELVRHFPPMLMLNCASIVCEWGKENISKIKRRIA